MKKTGALVLFFLVVVGGASAFFWVGFSDIVNHEATSLSRIFVIIGMVTLAGLFLLFDSELKKNHAVARGLIELAVGIVLTLLNITKIKSVNLTVFYSVLCAGVLACLKGLKDIKEGTE